MDSFVFPDYAGQGIVNLMQSIAVACGQPALPYRQLDALPAAALAESRHIVLLVIDGLGQSLLSRYPSPKLQAHAQATMTSVFPSTTASAITTFMSGLAPAQHALTGWHVHLAEIGETLAILPLTPRVGELPEGVSGQSLAPRLFAYPSLFSALQRECWTLAPRAIAGSAFNAWHARGAHTLAYATPDEMFEQIAGLLRDATAPRYIYAYVADLDSCAHRHGCDSAAVQQTLAALDAGFGRCVDAVQGTDSWLIVTADHGFIDAPESRVVSLDDHPRLAALLERPLCGERRAAYGYVAPRQRAALADYVAEHLAHCVDLRVSSELIAAGHYGPPPYHPRLADRVGDYTLLMRDDWTIKDWLPGEKRYRMLGVHGGASRDEMIVPLIALRV